MTVQSQCLLIPLQTGTTYNLSFWAMSNAPNLTLQFSFTALSPAGEDMQSLVLQSGNITEYDPLVLSCIVPN